MKKLMMTGNSVFRGNRIDVNNPVDVEYVHHQFPWLSHSQIKEIIKKHGPDRDAVQAALEKVRSSNREQE